MERPGGRPRLRATENGVKTTALAKKGERVSSSMVSHYTWRDDLSKTTTTAMGPENGRRSSLKDALSFVSEESWGHVDRSNREVNVDFIVEKEDETVLDSGWDVPTTYGADS
jgi:hypothetical protein